MIDPIDPAFRAALQDCPEDLGLMDEPDDLVRFAGDTSRAPASPPAFVLRPKSPAGVQAAMTLCQAFNQPLVLQGGLTGLSGAARPQTGEVALSTERLTAIEPVDVVGGRVTAEAGVPLERVQKAAEDAGLFFGVDIGARGSATVGGICSTNAGGVRVLRYGMTRDQVRGIEAVLADGSVLSDMRPLDKNNDGLDLKQLFVGSEGTLGVITRATFRLHPKPTIEKNALCAVAGPTEALALLSHLRGLLGPALSAFEGIWPNVYAGACEHIGQRPLAPGAGLYVLVEMHGFSGTTVEDALEQALLSAYEDGLCSDIVVSQSGRDFAALWELREACPEYTLSVGKLLAHDISLPLSVIPDFMARARSCVLAIDDQADFFVFGHLGDGNLHFLVQSREEGAVKQAVNALAADFGGSISAEHGVGVLKKPYLPLVLGTDEQLAMRRIKHVLDPTDILNRGRIL
ncbi:FAD-binding oxidoreductase [Amorphus sp. 3PC139-8]|uniref:FAD-binding oxidoreductase n=1 Tax=Amorphus sp. 3PC139-8 TaxID=2735676 RepID=UPI00345C634F